MCVCTEVAKYFIVQVNFSVPLFQELPFSISAGLAVHDDNVQWLSDRLMTERQKGNSTMICNRGLLSVVFTWLTSSFNLANTCSVMNMAILMCSSKWIIESSQTISIRRFVPVGVESRPHYVHLICCNVLRHSWKGISSSRCTIDHYCAISWANDKKRQQTDRRTFYDDEIFVFFFHDTRHSQCRQWKYWT